MTTQPSVIDGTEARAGAPRGWPSAGVGWYAVFVISLSLLVNFLDRGILALLVPYIKSDLRLSDFQISLVMGFAFVMFYMIAGLPIARYADRGHRRNLISFGLLLWSLATAMCAWSRSFVSLFAFRMGVGVGEACTGPASFSLLGDLFPPEKMPRVLAIMNFGFIAGTGLALVIGGTIVQSLATAGAIVFPVFGPLRIWQAAFLLVGLPGLVVSLMMLSVPEPARRETGPQPSIAQVLAFLVANRWVYGPLIATIAINTIVAVGSSSWGPAFYMRTFGWTIGRVGLTLGLVWLVVAPFGAMIGGSLAEALARRGRHDANLLVVVLSMLVSTPFAVLAPLMPTASLAIVMQAVAVFGAALLFGPQNAAIQVVTPNRMKGQVTAVVLFGFNIIGFGLGPTVTALFTDYLFRDERQVGHALATCHALLGPLAFVIMLIGMKPYARAVARMQRDGVS
ncbi:MAG TPA: MFS transporter [Caulobacteraceae bacterium]